MSRANTGAAPRSRITAHEAIEAYESMHRAGTDTHAPADWHRMAVVLLDAMPYARCEDTKELLLNYARDARQWAKRAEIAAKPAGAFYTARASSAGTIREIPDSTAWSRAEAEIDADDNDDADTTGDDGFTWGHAEW